MGHAWRVDENRERGVILHARLFYSLELDKAGVSIRALISRCKIRKKLARPTRFERVTFAFGGQGFCAAVAEYIFRCGGCRRRRLSADS